MRLIGLVLLSFLYSLVGIAQTVSQSSTSTSSIATSTSSHWIVATDFRTFGVSDVASDFFGLKVTYRADHRFMPYLFWNRFQWQKQETQGNASQWETSGVGVNYTFLGSSNSTPFLRIQSQNVESADEPYQSRISITSYGLGYHQIIGKLSLIASAMVNASGYQQEGDNSAPPYEFTPLATVIGLELGFFF